MSIISDLFSPKEKIMQILFWLPHYLNKSEIHYFEDVTWLPTPQRNAVKLIALYVVTIVQNTGHFKLQI